jgi:hypothetical protein
MKRFTILLLGTTLAAALLFEARTNSPPVKDKMHHMKHSTSGSHSMMPLKLK